MSVLVAAVAGAAILLPHALRLERASPMLAAWVWAAALVLRALVVVLAAVFALFVLPATEAFGLTTHWCWHAVIPVIAAELRVEGHQIGSLARIAPAFALGISLLSVTWALARATLAVRRLLHCNGLGPGPGGSLVIGGPQVVVAAAGLVRPHVIVSAGALTALDDEELAASLAHERGHIAHRHRYVVVLVASAQLWHASCRGLGVLRARSSSTWSATPTDTRLGAATTGSPWPAQSARG